MLHKIDLQNAAVFATSVTGVFEAKYSVNREEILKA